MHNITKHKKGEIPDGFLRVTQVLSPYKDFSHIPQAILEKASLRGQEVHRIAHLYALDLFIERPSEEVKGFFESFKIWFDTYVDEVFLSECRVSSEKLLLSGSPDLIARLKGSKEKVLIDWKTPATSCKTWRPQTAAYRMLLAQEKDIFCDRRMVVMLKKDGSPPIVEEHEKHDLDESIFMQLLTCYRFFHPKISFS